MSWYITPKGSANVRNFVRSVIWLSKKGNYQVIEHYENSIGGENDITIVKNKKLKSYKFIDYDSPCCCNDEQKYVSKPCGYDACSHTCYSGEKNPIWRDFDITDGFDEDYEYRKKQPKTWLEETFPLGDVVDDTHTEGEKERLGIKAFYEEFMRRVESKVMRVDCDLYLDNMRFIAKEMGVE